MYDKQPKLTVADLFCFILFFGRCCLQEKGKVEGEMLVLAENTISRVFSIFPKEIGNDKCDELE